MPIFMDRHDVSESISAEILAEIHQEDLKIEKDFNCRGFTYWFDSKRKHVFCLIEAPNKQAIEAMHRQAHGDVPNTIIEVEPNIVESFLGRISDPVNAKNSALNIIEDSAFRILMVVKNNEVTKLNSPETEYKIPESNRTINKIIKQNQGTIVKQTNSSYLISFKSTVPAISCALHLNSEFKTDLHAASHLKIGIAAGDPVTNKMELFEDTIVLTNRICDNINSEIAMTYELKLLYENEQRTLIKDYKPIRVLLPAEESFLTCLIDIMKQSWQNSEFNIDDFSVKMGYSKSQLYRKLTNLTGKSPNTFIKDYRLHRAKKLLDDQKGNISEIAFETGFNSVAYFSKCFKTKFNILPSKYLA